MNREKIIKSKYSYEKINNKQTSEKFEDNFQVIFEPNIKYQIFDSRKLIDFKTQTFGGYSKSDVNSQLDKAIQAEELEKSIYLSFQLLFSGYVNLLWDKLVNLIYKNINTNNPNIPKFMYEKQKKWDSIVLQKIYKKDNILLLRNNVIIRELIVELVCIIILSRKRKLEQLKKITKSDFVLSSFKSRLEAKDSSLSSNYLKENDPSEVRIAMNELVYQMKQRNFDKVLYWLSWMLEWDKLNVKQYGKFKVHPRLVQGVEPKFATNIIWLIWEYINDIRFKVNTFTNNNSLTNEDNEQINYLWKCFTLNYSNTKRNKRIHLVIWALKIIVSPLDFSIKLIDKEYLLFQILANYNIMIEKIKSQENNKNDYQLSKYNLVIKNNYIQTENYKKIREEKYEDQMRKQKEIREKEAKKKKISIDSLNKLDRMKIIDKYAN